MKNSGLFWPALRLQCVLLIFACSALADVVSIFPAKDNTLYQDNNGALSNGAGSHIFVGAAGQGLMRRTLLYFDIGGNVPAGATINSATLSLSLTRTVAGSTTVTVHRVLAAWGEGASLAPGEQGMGTQAAPGDATWLNTFYDNLFWTNPGGDYDPAESALTAVDAVGRYDWSSATLTDDVQNWLDSPADNFGWMLRGDEGSGSTAKRFDSREATTPETRPVLTINFTTVPEPSTGAAILLSLGWPMLRRRIYS